MIVNNITSIHKPFESRQAPYEKAFNDNNVNYFTEQGNKKAV